MGVLRQRVRLKSAPVAEARQATGAHYATLSRNRPQPLPFAASRARESSRRAGRARIVRQNSMNASRWRLDGKVALIAGASKGIGYACARELAALGADVLLVSRDEASLEHAQSELAEEFADREFFMFAADVAEAEQRL